MLGQLYRCPGLCDLLGHHVKQCGGSDVTVSYCCCICRRCITSCCCRLLRCCCRGLLCCCTTYTMLQRPGLAKSSGFVIQSRNGLCDFGLQVQNISAHSATAHHTSLLEDCTVQTSLHEAATAHITNYNVGHTAVLRGPSV